MLLILRFLAVTLSVVIVLSIVLCAWSLWDHAHRMDDHRGEVLMVLPASSFFGGVAGLLTTVIVLFNRNRITRAERVTVLMMPAVRNCLYSSNYIRSLSS